MASLSRRDVLLGAAAVAAILIIALATISPPEPGAGLHALAQRAARAADAKLSAGSTLGELVPQITKQFAADGGTVSVVDRQGHTLSPRSATVRLTPAVTPAAIAASLAGSDVRLAAWQGDREAGSALAPLRAKGQAAGVIVASGRVSSSSGVGTARTAVILVCAVLLAALGFLAGRVFGKPVGPVKADVRRHEPSAEATGPVATRRADAAATSNDELIRRLLELEEIAPSGVFRERLVATMQDAGVQEDDPTGEPFDPRLHRAVERVATEDSALHNTIAETIRPGYSLRGRVLSQAEVTVYRRTAP